MNKLFYPALFHKADEGGLLGFVSRFSGMSDTRREHVERLQNGT